mgnify:CR=1 FL=1
MIEKVLFSGKDINTGKLVYGYYVNKSGLPSNHIIKTYSCDSNGEIIEEDYLIYEDSLSRYTGRKDIIGNDIYENDILITDYGIGGTYATVKYGEYTEKGGNNNLGFYVEFPTEFLNTILRRDLLFWLTNSKVVGKAYDKNKG